MLKIESGNEALMERQTDTQTQILYVWVEALHLKQQYFSHVRTLTWVELVIKAMTMKCLVQEQHSTPLVIFKPGS